MAHKLLDAVTAVGVSRALLIRKGIEKHTVATVFNSTTTTEISAVVAKLQGSETGEDKDTGVITEAGLVIGSITDRIANIAFDFQIANTSYSKGAVAAGSAWSFIDKFSTHTITASKFGGWNIYINAAGTIAMAGPVDGPQAYATIALANTAVDAISDINLNSTGYTKIGKLLIENQAALFTADTTALSSATSYSLVSLGSSFTDLATITFTADELANARAIRTIIDAPTKYARIYLSTLTGTGEVTSRYTPSGGY